MYGQMLIGRFRVVRKRSPFGIVEKAIAFKASMYKRVEIGKVAIYLQDG
jgi:hypothetical protein